MHRYQVVGYFKLRVNKEVEADSPEEAERLVVEMGIDAADFMSEEFDAWDVVEIDGRDEA